MRHGALERGRVWNWRLGKATGMGKKRRWIRDEWDWDEEPGERKRQVRRDGAEGVNLGGKWRKS